MIGSGRLYGLGTGPGDPELLTLKAVRILHSVDVVAHFAKRGAPGNARRTVAARLRAEAIELPLVYPVTTELPRHSAGYRTQIEEFYAASAAAVAAHLEAGRSVAVLSEGDPLFYGSYMHLHVRLAPHYPTEVVPGVTGMSACWSMAGTPVAQGDDVLMVLPGMLEDAELRRRLATAEAVVIMKVGRNLPRIRAALAATGRLDGAIYVERGSMDAAAVVPLAARDDAPAPYFSIILVPGWAGT